MTLITLHHNQEIALVNLGVPSVVDKHLQPNIKNRPDHVAAKSVHFVAAIWALGRLPPRPPPSRARMK